MVYSREKRYLPLFSLHVNDCDPSNTYVFAYVYCVFANKIEHGKTTITMTFFRKSLQILLQKIMFLSVKLISFYQKLHYVKRPNRSM